MALAFNTGLTNITTAEAVGSFVGFNDGSGPTPSPALTTEIFLQGSGSVGGKFSGSGQNKGIWWDFGAGSEVDFMATGRHFYGWIQITTPAILNAIASGGLYVKAASDAAGNNWSKWFVSGSDVYPGGWARVVLDLNKTASETAATAATISSVRFIGFGVKATGSSVADNVYIDRMDYGQAALQGFNDAAGSVSADWQAYFDEDNASANKYGVIDKRGSVFYLRGGIVWGDAAQSGAFTFADATGAVVEFENPLYHNGTGLVSAIDAPNLYKISAEGAGAQLTTVTLGSSVGTGDDRQGLLGGQIQTAGPDFGIDLQSGIANLAAVDLLGVNIVGAGEGVLLDDGLKTSGISVAFVNCGEVDPGSVNSGAEILSCFVIDPDDANATENRGLRFPNTIHKVKKVSFITSGSPATQHMMHLTQAADYAIAAEGLNFFGDFSSASLWHGENSGAGADVTINVSGGGNADQTEFENTGTPTAGTVTVNNPVNQTITGLPANSEITWTDTLDPPTELFHVEDVGAGGSATYPFNGADSGNDVIIVMIPPAGSGFAVDDLETTLPAADQTIPVNLPEDPVYFNPA